MMDIEEKYAQSDHLSYFQISQILGEINAQKILSIHT